MAVLLTAALTSAGVAAGIIYVFVHRSEQHEQSNRMITASVHGPPMPPVISLTLAPAEARIKAATGARRLDLQCVDTPLPAGKIVGQIPAAGTLVIPTNVSRGSRGLAHGRRTATKTRPR